jgi:phosphoenolpyruvate carboxykinase (ATP)
VVFLTCDAYGVLPPISRLTEAQAMYHFLSGYTAKVAGTERGVTEPTATFSACFGSPFLPRHPTVYAKMLGEKLARHGANCWLVNTGWNGTGNRMKLAHTRAMVGAALAGRLDAVEYKNDAIFGVAVPQSCPDVPAEILNVQDTWADQGAYQEKARQLARRFAENFETIGEGAAPEVAAAGPRA